MAKHHHTEPTTHNVPSSALNRDLQHVPLFPVLLGPVEGSLSEGVVKENIWVCFAEWHGEENPG